MAGSTNKAWDGSASRYKDTPAYCDACLINENEGPREQWTQDKCHLPVKEPDGTVNENAVRAAMARIGQVDAKGENKQKAMARLLAMRKQYGIGADNQGNGPSNGNG